MHRHHQRTNGLHRLRHADGNATVVDAREVAPGAAHRDMYRGNPMASLDGTERPIHHHHHRQVLLYTLNRVGIAGPLAIAVPGEIRGLEVLARSRVSCRSLARSHARYAVHLEKVWLAQRQVERAVRGSDQYRRLV